MPSEGFPTEDGDKEEELDNAEAISQLIESSKNAEEEVVRFADGGQISRTLFKVIYQHYPNLLGRFPKEDSLSNDGDEDMLRTIFEVPKSKAPVIHKILEDDVVAVLNTRIHIGRRSDLPTLVALFDNLVSKNLVTKAEGDALYAWYLQKISDSLEKSTSKYKDQRENFALAELIVLKVEHGVFPMPVVGLRDVLIKAIERSLAK